jgi:phage terminase small subunit
MGAIISDADISYLQQIYPMEGVVPLTGQQEQFLMHYMKGQSVAAAERAVGYAPGTGKKLLTQENVLVILEHLRSKAFDDIRVTREVLTQMLFEAHGKSATATEEINAIKELGKMHDMYEVDKRHQGNVTNVLVDKRVTNVKQIERASEADLLLLAGDSISLDPADYKIIEDDSDG